VYAEFALSEEYTKMYGDVVNALTSYKKQLHKYVDDQLEQMNLPNRQEIDSVHKRVHEMRRENIQLRKDIEALKAAVGLKEKPKSATTAAKAPAKTTPTPIKKTAVEKTKPAKAKTAKTVKSAVKKPTAKKKAGKK
jgi:BMFP domain-containing protein YqiC